MRQLLQMVLSSPTKTKFENLTVEKSTKKVVEMTDAFLSTHEFVLGQTIRWAEQRRYINLLEPRHEEIDKALGMLGLQIVEQFMI